MRPTSKRLRSEGGSETVEAVFISLAILSFLLLVVGFILLAAGGEVFMYRGYMRERDAKIWGRELSRQFQKREWCGDNPMWGEGSREGC